MNNNEKIGGSEEKEKCRSKLIDYYHHTGRSEEPNTQLTCEYLNRLFMERNRKKMSNHML